MDVKPRWSFLSVVVIKTWYNQLFYDLPRHLRACATGLTLQANCHIVDEFYQYLVCDMKWLRLSNLVMIIVLV
ncbi:MAG TPA: hypothetical protein VGA99_09350, partial [bacterium]